VSAPLPGSRGLIYTNPVFRSHIDTTAVQALIDTRTEIEKWADHPIEVRPSSGIFFLTYRVKDFASSILLPSSLPGFAALSSQAASVPAFPPRRCARLRQSFQTNTMPPEFQISNRKMLNLEMTSKSGALDWNQTTMPQLFLPRRLSSTLTWRELSGPQKAVSDECRTNFLSVFGSPWMLDLRRQSSYWYLYSHTNVTISPNLPA